MPDPPAKSPRERIVLVLEDLGCIDLDGREVPLAVRLRRLLKTALRRDRLKCIGYGRIEDNMMNMVNFKGGPADGHTLTLVRAPLYLRVVHDSAADKWDALDQLDDVAAPGETIHAYRLASRDGTCHVDRTVEGRRVGSWYALTSYAVIDPQPADEALRDNAAWQEWVRADHVRRQKPEDAP